MAVWRKLLEHQEELLRLMCKSWAAAAWTLCEVLRERYCKADSAQHPLQLT